MRIVDFYIFQPYYLDIMWNGVTPQSSLKWNCYFQEELEVAREKVDCDSAIVQKQSAALDAMVGQVGDCPNSFHHERSWKIMEEIMKD